MKVLLFSDAEIWEVLKLLAALLHMGNVKYRATVVGKRSHFNGYARCRQIRLESPRISATFPDNLDATEIPEQTNVQRVAHLLGVPVQSLIDALTRRTIFAHGETVVSNK